MSPLAIFTRAPIWAWAVLAVLLVLGLRATKRRETRVWVMALPPLLVLLALRSMAGMHAGPPGWLALALGYGMGAWTGLRLQPRWTLGKRNGRVALAGEAVSITLMLTLFALNFAAGVLHAVAPAALASMPVQLGFGLVEGLVSGSFLGRALYVLKLTEIAPARPG